MKTKICPSLASAYWHATNTLHKTACLLQAIILAAVFFLFSTSCRAQCLQDFTDTKPYTLTQRGQMAGFPATNAFNNSNTAVDGWQELRNVAVGNESWLQVQFTGGPEIVKGYSITAMNQITTPTGLNIAPKDFRFQGSTNGMTWTTLDTRVGLAFTNQWQTRLLSFSNTTPYSYYRLFISETFKTNSTVVGIAEMQLFADICLTGTVFNDNGDRLPGYNAVNDMPLSGVQLNIIDVNLGNVYSATTTDALGKYSFTGGQLPSAGSFSIIVTPPIGKILVSQPATLLIPSLNIQAPEEEPASGAILFDYDRNLQGTRDVATNRMLFAGGNVDFGLKDTTRHTNTLVCFGTGSVGSNLITLASNGSFGSSSSATWLTRHPHQRAFQFSTSTLFSNPLTAVTNTDYTYMNNDVSGVIYGTQTYTTTSFAGTLSDRSDQTYLSNLLNGYYNAGTGLYTGFRKTLGATTGDVYDQFLAVNGASTPGNYFFRQPGINLTSGTSYSVSFYAKTASSYAQIVSYGASNGVVVLDVVDNAGIVIATANMPLPDPISYADDYPESAWQFKTLAFTAPGTGNPFTVRLSSSTLAVAGNDFYVDNITLTPCSGVTLLPLVIKSFNASLEADFTIQLNWKIDNAEPAKAIVEYSTDGLHFESIGIMQMQAGVENYQFSHKEPRQQINYYRLKIETGKEQPLYSSVRKVVLSKKPYNISLYPNPLHNKLYVSGPEKISSVLITNISGKTIVRLQNINTKDIIIDTDSWKPGVYVVKVIDAIKTIQSKVIVRANN